MPDAELPLPRAPAASDDAALLAHAVRQAGVRAMSYRGKPVKTWTKGSSSPVSEADIAVNDLLQETLRTARPHYGWLSEETPDADERLTREAVWVVDPIDGTRAFLAGGDDWSISVALVHGGRPVVAAVFAPATDEFFFAARGDGARRNGAPIRATDDAGDAPTRVAGPQRLLDRLNFPQLPLIVVPKIGSLALRFARVAEGRLDAALAGGNSHDWDLAAADLLVHEAGGRMTSLAGEGMVYNRPHIVHPVLVAAGGDRHARLIGHIRQTGRLS